MQDIFGVKESTDFAKALAASEDIRVKQVNNNVTPTSMKDGSILIGTPSIYNSNEYMGHLHREISKQSKDMRFFMSLETGEDTFESFAVPILQGQRTEYHMHDEYEGRDRILASQYREDVQKAGGISSLISDIAKVNPTAAAMLYVGNEMRNDWQSYNYCEMPKEIEKEVNRIRPVLEEEWLNLDSKESLETLLYQLKTEEQQEEQDAQGPGGECTEGDSGGEGSEGSSDQSDKDGTSGSESEGEGNSQEQKDQGSEDGSSGAGEGSGSGEGQEEDGQEGSGDKREDGGGEQQAEGNEQGSSGEEQGVGGSEGKGERGDPGREPNAEGGEQQTQDTSGATDGQGSETNGDPTEHCNHGASQVTAKLKDIGLTKEAIQDKHSAEVNHAPYIPESRLKETDMTSRSSYSYSRYTEEMKRHLDGFSMSRKIKKYLISMSQVGYQYGLTRGKLCNKNISRIYAGHTQPRIFKQKRTSKIQQDSAVFILGDVSGSMSYKKYSVSAACQISISEVLQSLHIPHMMMQFTSEDRGWESVGRHHYIMKKFNEMSVSRDILVKRYGDGNIEMGCNADGEAVTEAAQILAARPEKNKVLIVLSDGQPAYGDGDDHQFLLDSVKSIEESNVMSIYGVGIQSRAVKEYYTNSEVVNNLSELERVLLELLKNEVLR